MKSPFADRADQSLIDEVMTELETVSTDRDLQGQRRRQGPVSRSTACKPRTSAS